MMMIRRASRRQPMPRARAPNFMASQCRLFRRVIATRAMAAIPGRAYRLAADYRTAFFSVPTQ